MHGNFRALEPIEGVERRTLADTVTARVRDAIVSGQLAPGQRLTESLLADQLNVSRSPVREALYRLKTEGLVSGTVTRYVWEPNAADVDDVLGMRRLLASRAAECAVDEMTEPDFAELQALLTKTVGTPVTQEPSLTSVLDLERRFYSYICWRSGHLLLFRWWRQVAAQWTVLVRSCLVHWATDVGDGDPRFVEVPFADVARQIITHERAVWRALQLRDLATVKELLRSNNDWLGLQIKAALQERAIRPGGPAGRPPGRR